MIVEALRISEERLNIAMRGTRAGLWDWDMKQNTVVYSPTWKSMLGYAMHEVPDDFSGWKNLWHPDDVMRIEQSISDYLSGKEEAYEISHRLRCKNGQWRWIMTRGEVIRDSQGKPIRWVGTNIDLTHMKEVEDKIVYLSFHDQLTGLYNRRFYEEELNRLDQERNLPLSIIMADVNGLKLANDAFGHTIGDDLLQKAADTMKKFCRADEIISRIGGDEFVILLPKTGLKEAEAVVRRIRQSMGKVKAGMLDLSISFGCATKMCNIEPIGDVIKKAEENMYQIKLSESPRMKRKTVSRILTALFERLPDEKLHSNTVGKLCHAIGKQLGLDSGELDVLKKAGIMHDIGKITLSNDILAKPGLLTDAEWIEVKRHPVTGYQILNSVNELALVAKVVLHHHEHWDGSGYPDGLKAGKIPLQSRIIAVADAIQAMLSDRPYRKALTFEEAMAELQNNAGTQFDPDIIKILIEHPSIVRVSGVVHE
jgi:diguanylate cyclase (GGDEF)-like protein/PAS domain S-box-containing protein